MDILKTLPLEPPKRFKKWAEKQDFFRKQHALTYHFCWTGEKGHKKRSVECHCSACGAVYYRPYRPRGQNDWDSYSFEEKGLRFSSHTSALCAVCGAAVTVLLVPPGRMVSLINANFLDVTAYRGHYLNQCYLSYWFQDAQVKDVLFYDEKEAKIANNSSLIAKLYNNNPLEYPFSWENFELNGSPLASYSISGDSMFLTNVIVCSGLGFYERNEDSVSLSALFDEKNIENGKVFANWIDGDIYLKYGKTMYSDFGSERFFVERMQKIVLDSGRVVGMEWTPCDFNSDIVSNPVSVCDTSKIYVSQSNILEYYDDSLQPKTLPYWADGDSVLEAWFETQTIDDEREFRWNVAFVVNCKGEVGGWTLISPSGSVFDDYEVIEMRDALFDILSKLPNKWVPATDENGNPVDCRMAFDIRLVDKKLKGEIDVY